MKIEIEIPDWYETHKLISRSGDTIHLESDAFGRQYVTNLKIASSELGYDHQTVLREEWVPKWGEDYFIIYPDNRISKSANILRGRIERLASEGKVFAPTRELAEEIVQIREGKWLPKKGDFACGYNSKNGKCSSWICADMEHDWTEEGREPNCHYFPSIPQRNRYIEKKKEYVVITLPDRERTWEKGDVIKIEKSLFEKLNPNIHVDSGGICK